DILVNCAEVEPQKTVLEMDEWDWVRTLDVNLTGAFLLTQSAGRIMKEKGSGIIVHIGERAKGPEKRAAYLASKAGLEAMVNTAAEELAPLGVKVRFVPGGSHSAEEIVKFCLPVEEEIFPTPEIEIADLDYLFSGLRKAPQEVRRILREIPDFFEEEPHTDGSWNPHQIIAHMRDVNREVYILRLNQIIEQTNPSFQEFDGELWMEQHYASSEPIKDLVDDLAQQCEETADLLEALRDEDWQRTGTHISLGTHSLQWWADRMVAHIGEHLAQLRGE
ncbi:SDR family NAD(P)-dependent oxidoreductase, partial [bacterium]|nr:SDR family NAD(P)-dependent oxidoreductase [bacterium]